MIMKFYLIITAIAILLSSCLKQSIPDAMLGISKQTKITATLRYEINGNLVSISVDDADRQRVMAPVQSGVTRRHEGLSGDPAVARRVRVRTDARRLRADRRRRCGRDDDAGVGRVLPDPGRSAHARPGARA